MTKGMNMTFKKQLLALSASMVLAGTAMQAQAAAIAIFGNNNIATYYGGLAGHTATVVSDAQLATAGFLDSFDVFVYTRDGYSFGTTLSLAAAANVKAFVNGNVALLNGDFQDDIGTPGTDQLFLNILNYVAGNSNGGYIGEFNGASAAFTSNDNGLTPIGLIEGHSGTLGNGNGGSDGDVVVTPYGTASGLFAGVAFPYNPGAVEFGADASVNNPATVLATFSNGNPAIIVGERQVINNPNQVPEPSTYALLLAALGGVVATRRRRS